MSKVTIQSIAPDGDVVACCLWFNGVQPTIRTDENGLYVIDIHVCTASGLGNRSVRYLID